MTTRFQQARDDLKADAEQKWKADANVRAEFDNDFDRYLSYRAAESTGQARTLGGQTRV